jgi:hypothetical protein
VPDEYELPSAGTDASNAHFFPSPTAVSPPKRREFAKDLWSVFFIEGNSHLVAPFMPTSDKGRDYQQYVVLLVVTTFIRCWHKWGDKMRIALYKENRPEIFIVARIDSRLLGGETAVGDGKKWALEASVPALGSSAGSHDLYPMLA